MRNYTNELLRDKIRGSLFGFVIGSGENHENTELMLCISHAFKDAIQDQTRSFEQRCCFYLEDWYLQIRTLQNYTSSNNSNSTTKKVIASAFGQSVHTWMETAHEVAEKEGVDNGALLRCLFLALVDEETPAISQGLLTHNKSESSRCISLFVKRIQYLLNRTSQSTIPNTDHLEPTSSCINSFTNAVHWSQECDFATAILKAQEDGGDADAIAALTGALAGARFGYNGISASFRNRIPTDLHNTLCSLADDAVEIINFKQGQEDFTK